MAAAPPAPFADTVLMCGKCARKLGANGKALRTALRQALKTGRWGRVQLAQTRCFSLCPNGGQVLAAVRKIGERRLLVVQPAAAVESALDYLLAPPRDAGDAANPDPDVGGPARPAGG